MENAFQTAIAQEGADNLYGTSLWQENEVSATQEIERSLLDA